jgi:thymidylate synthase (FAD)
MKFIEKPRVYLVAKTALEAGGLSAYLRDIGSPEWAPDPAVSDAENLIEAAGRMCYRSWQPYDPDKPEASNPNVTRVRQGNKHYIGHVLEAAHGSVLEHASMTFICRGVSRVFTHELVRHRAGMAYSQESLRYVRLDELSFWLPARLRDNEEARGRVKDALDFLEGIQKELAALFAIEDIRDFQTKKELTSAFRRLAPTGLATSIMVTGTLRAWRHIIALRTSRAAEEEIRQVLGQIARICLREFPHVFQDMSFNEESGEWTFTHAKV